MYTSKYGQQARVPWLFRPFLAQTRDPEPSTRTTMEQNRVCWASVRKQTPEQNRVLLGLPRPATIPPPAPATGRAPPASGGVQRRRNRPRRWPATAHGRPRGAAGGGSHHQQWRRHDPASRTMPRRRRRRRWCLCGRGSGGRSWCGWRSARRGRLPRAIIAMMVRNGRPRRDRVQRRRRAGGAPKQNRGTGARHPAAGQ